MHKQVLNYNGFMYFTDDPFKFFLIKDGAVKKSYEKLIKKLPGKIYVRNLFIIKQLIEKVTNF